MPGLDQTGSRREQPEWGTTGEWASAAIRSLARPRANPNCGLDHDPWQHPPVDDPGSWAESDRARGGARKALAATPSVRIRWLLAHATRGAVHPSGGSPRASGSTVSSARPESRGDPVRPHRPGSARRPSREPSGIHPSLRCREGVSRDHPPPLGRGAGSAPERQPLVSPSQAQYLRGSSDCQRNHPSHPAEPGPAATRCGPKDRRRSAYVR